MGTAVISSIKAESTQRKAALCEEKDQSFYSIPLGDLPLSYSLASFLHHLLCVHIQLTESTYQLYPLIYLMSISPDIFLQYTHAFYVNRLYVHGLINLELKTLRRKLCMYSTSIDFFVIIP